MRVAWPSNEVREDFLNATISAIGRQVEIRYVTGVSGCSTCILDPVNNTSTDSFCPECSGVYWHPILETTTPSGHIRWKKADELDWSSGGKLFDGDCQVRLNYTVDLESILDTATAFVVDGKELQIKTIRFKGAPKVNRISVSLMEREK